MKKENENFLIEKVKSYINKKVQHLASFQTSQLKEQLKELKEAHSKEISKSILNQRIYKAVFDSIKAGKNTFHNALIDRKKLTDYWKESAFYYITIRNSIGVKFDKQNFNNENNSSIVLSDEKEIESQEKKLKQELRENGNFQ